MDHQVIKNLPVGFRFLPTDAELIEYYLKGKNLGFHFPDTPIHDCYIYDFNPEDLIGMYGMGEKQDMYFFSEREPVTACGLRPNRTAVGGHWRSNRSYEVRDNEDRIIGVRMSLKFFKGKKESTDWLMDEYKLPEGDEAMTSTREKKRRKMTMAENQNSIHRLKMEGFVLCRIHRRGKRPEANKNIRCTYPVESTTSDDSQNPAALEDFRASQFDDFGIDHIELLNSPAAPQSDDFSIDNGELLSPPAAPQSDDFRIDVEELLSLPAAPQSDDFGIDVEELLSPTAAPQSDDFCIDVEELLSLPAAPQSDDFGIDVEELLSPPAAPQSDDFSIDIEEFLNPRAEDSKAPQSDDFGIDVEELLSQPEDSRAPKSDDFGMDIEEVLKPQEDSKAPQYVDFDIAIEELLKATEDSKAPQSDDFCMDIEETLNSPEDSKAPQSDDHDIDHTEELLGSPEGSGAPQYDLDEYADIDVEELLNLLD
ncbi:hypothetical protein ACLOJK_033032 [Asimina triloba]